MVIAGIGSRKLPINACEKILGFTHKFLRENPGSYIRTGAAQGSDRAFMTGAKERSIVYLPWNGYELKSIVENKSLIGAQAPTEEAMKIASKHHPNWDNLTDGVKKLHGRNVHIILGRHLNSPVEYVAYWTPNGEEVGGTGMGLRIAKSYNIPVKFIENIY